MKITTLEANNNLTGMYRVDSSITYRNNNGNPLTLDIIHPWSKKTKLPLIVFIQGSGWTIPDTGFELPQLCYVARAGFAVATIKHRNIFENSSAFAAIEDTEYAIKYLVDHAEKYSIDTQKISVWGSSSGANTAQMIGVTQTFSNILKDIKIDKVVSCFGPSNMVRWCQKMYSNPEFTKTIDTLFPNKDIELKRKMSPINYVKEGMYLPEFLMLQGDSDSFVEVSQMTNMINKINEVNGKAEGIIIKGGHHEDNFWSYKLIDKTIQFLKL